MHTNAADERSCWDLIAHITHLVERERFGHGFAYMSVARNSIEAYGSGWLLVLASKRLPYILCDVKSFKALLSGSKY